MDLWQLFNDLFFDYTLRTVALGTAVLGIVSGSLGSFALLRKQSLLGDAISHAALPGVVIAFLLTRSKTAGILLIGALIAGWLATLLISNVVRHTRIKEDSALGLALSLFFGLGLMLLTITQNLPDARQAGLDRFLFGQAAALVERDVITLSVLGLVALLAVALFWKEFKLLSFDPEYAASLGLPVRLLDVTLTTLLVVAVVIGLQAVGVILMSAMVVAPAAAARQWTNRLGKMVLLGGAIGAFSGVGGTVISSTRPGLATGPVIVLVASSVVLISMFLAPNRGLAWRWVRQLRNRRQLRLETVLSDLYRLELQHNGHEKGHSIAVLRTMNAQRGGVARSLEKLAEQGLVQQPQPDHWQLTTAGTAAAEKFLQSTRQTQNVLAADLPSAAETEVIR